MFVKNKNTKFFIIMLCISHMAQTSLHVSDNNQDFLQVCLLEGIEYIVKNTPNRSPEDEYLMRQRYRARAQSHPGFASGLQTTGFLAMTQDQEKAKILLSVTHKETQTVAPYQRSNFHLRGQLLDRGIELLISQTPTLTPEEIHLKRQSYKKQAINDHEFARRTRETGWRALKVEENLKEQALAIQTALQEHAHITELIMKAAQAEKYAFAEQSKQMIAAITAKQLVDDALKMLKLHAEICRSSGIGSSGIGSSDI